MAHLHRQVKANRQRQNPLQRLLRRLRHPKPKRRHRRAATAAPLPHSRVKPKPRRPQRLLPRSHIAAALTVLPLRSPARMELPRITARLLRMALLGHPPTIAHLLPMERPLMEHPPMAQLPRMAIHPHPQQRLKKQTTTKTLKYKEVSCASYSTEAHSSLLK